MRKLFEGRLRTVPKCEECNSDEYVCLSTYKVAKNKKEKYWECFRCYAVVRKARL